MGYESWLTAHTKKHSGIVGRLSGLDTDEILEYFLYENMIKNEPDFCPLYQKNKKCHDIEGLNSISLLLRYYMGYYGWVLDFKYV